MRLVAGRFSGDPIKCEVVKVALAAGFPSPELRKRDGGAGYRSIGHADGNQSRPQLESCAIGFCAHPGKQPRGNHAENKSGAQAKDALRRRLVERCRLLRRAGMAPDLERIREGTGAERGDLKLGAPGKAWAPVSASRTCHSSASHSLRHSLRRLPGTRREAARSKSKFAACIARSNRRLHTIFASSSGMKRSSKG